MTAMATNIGSGAPPMVNFDIREGVASGVALA